jgi:hypothetical protein
MAASTTVASMPPQSAVLLLKKLRRPFVSGVTLPRAAGPQIAYAGGDLSVMADRRWSEPRLGAKECELRPR